MYRGEELKTLTENKQVEKLKITLGERDAGSWSQYHRGMLEVVGST